MSHTILSEALPEWIQLRTASRKARQHAYCRYSRYPVGAAVLTEAGGIYSGCNVENASYGLTICAERVAVCNAVSSGDVHIKAICISLEGIAVPCGACRQFLYEFNPQMLILLDNPCAPEHPTEAVRLSDLLPRAFRLDPPAQHSR